MHVVSSPWLSYQGRSRALRALGYDVHPNVRIERGFELVERGLSLGEGTYVNRG